MSYEPREFLLDRLVHNCFGVDLDIVWDLLQTKIPTLRDEVRRILGAS